MRHGRRKRGATARARAPRVHIYCGGAVLKILNLSMLAYRDRGEYLTLSKSNRSPERRRNVICSYVNATRELRLQPLAVKNHCLRRRRSRRRATWPRPFASQSPGAWLRRHAAACRSFRGRTARRERMKTSSRSSWAPHAYTTLAAGKTASNAFLRRCRLRRHWISWHLGAPGRLHTSTWIASLPRSP